MPSSDAGVKLHPAGLSSLVAERLDAVSLILHPTHIWAALLAADARGHLCAPNHEARRLDHEPGIVDRSVRVVRRVSLGRNEIDIAVEG